MLVDAPNERITIKEAIAQFEGIGKEDMSLTKKRIMDLMQTLNNKITDKEFLNKMNVNTDIHRISQQTIPVLLTRNEKDYEY